MSSFEGFPILAEHVGQWQGEYVHLDADGNEVDRHKSHLNCTVPEDGEFAIHQVNTYTWPDGSEEQYGFGGTLRDGVIYFDTDRIVGSMKQVDDRTILLVWSYKELLKPGNSVHEHIQLSQDGQEKVRTWHWMEGDRLVRRTVIRERKVS